MEHYAPVAALAPMLLALFARSASAHPINTALSVISKDAVRIGHGLVTRDQKGRWRFICPTTWGGPIAPLSLSLGDAILVIGEQDAYSMSIDGIAAPLSAGIRASEVRELERAGDRVLALSTNAGGSSIVAFAPPQRIVDDDRWLHSIEASEGGFVVTTSVSEGVRVEMRGQDGAELGASIVRYADVATATVGIERAGGEMYAVIAQPDEYILARIEPDRLRLLASSTSPILGPVRAGDEVWFIQDGALLRLAGNDVEVIDQTQLYSCLEEEGGIVFACIGTQIFTLSPTTEMIFDLAEVKGPRLAHFDPEPRVDCEFEWNIFAGEVGLDPSIPDDTELPPDPECGCSATRTGMSHLPGMLLLLACLRAWRHRSRRMVSLGGR